MNLTPQQSEAVERLKALDSGNEVYWDEATATPNFAKGTLSAPSDDDAEAIARRFLDEHRGLMGFADGVDESLELSHREADAGGFQHISFLQHLDGIPVFEGSVQVHVDGEGRVVAYKDHRLARSEVSREVRVSEEAAIASVVEQWQGGAIEAPAASLEYFRDGEKNTHLAWEVAIREEDGFDESHYFVDAHTGQLLYRFSEVRGALSRVTHTAANGLVLPGQRVLEDDQDQSDDSVAEAAHRNARVVYEYFFDTFGRDSYDGNGATIRSTVHYRQDYNNAFWSDRRQQMVYGDGDGVRFGPLALALDVVGHELTHAVTSRTARFVYAEQSGALDESFADIFGLFVTNDDEIVDWEMGEGVFTPFRAGDALRDIGDPPRFGQPDHMDAFLALAPGELPDPDKNDNGYVHSNSGIPNKVAYLMIEGGTHHDVRVEPVPRARAEQIYYIALTQYLSSSTRSRWTFKEARFAMLNACRQLYGDGGAEYATVKNAWAAVGVGEPAGDLDSLQIEAAASLAIPDRAPSGVRSTLEVPRAGVVKDVSVSVEIAHSYIGDLRIVIEPPDGEAVVLHDREGRSAHDVDKTYDRSTTPALHNLVGRSIEGSWSLWVSDHASLDAGTLRRWALRLVTEPMGPQTVEKSATPALEIQDPPHSGIESAIEMPASGTLANLEVEVDITHSYIGDLRVSLSAPDGSGVVLHARSGSSRHDIRKTYKLGDFAPLEALLGVSVEGQWKLAVSDHAMADTGRLNRWGIKVTTS